MEPQHRLARQIIHTAVSKGMEDMKVNPRRGLRNLVDLALYFSESEQQKQFFEAAQKVISASRNPYPALITRMISDVNNDIVRQVGLNLGYSSLIHGAHKLKERQEELKVRLPWLLIFDVCRPDPVFFCRLEQFLREGQELGIYSYIFCPRQNGAIPLLCQMANRFEECLFVLNVTPEMISEQNARVIGGIHNAMVSLEIAKGSLAEEKNAGAFRLLKQNRCLYGFHAGYKEAADLDRITDPEYVREAIALGNIFGVYIAEPGTSDTCREAVYAFACRSRGKNGQPLVILEWERDIQNIGESILSGDGDLRLPPAKGLGRWHVKAKDLLAKPLSEILRGTGI